MCVISYLSYIVLSYVGYIVLELYSSVICALHHFEKLKFSILCMHGVRLPIYKDFISKTLWFYATSTLVYKMCVLTACKTVIKSDQNFLNFK